MCSAIQYPIQYLWEYLFNIPSIYTSWDILQDSEIVYPKMRSIFTFCPTLGYKLPISPAQEVFAVLWAVFSRHRCWTSRVRTLLVHPRHPPECCQTSRAAASGTGTSGTGHPNPGTIPSQRRWHLCKKGRLGFMGFTRRPCLARGSKGFKSSVNLQEFLWAFRLQQKPSWPKWLNGSFSESSVDFPKSGVCRSRTYFAVHLCCASSTRGEGAWRARLQSFHVAVVGDVRALLATMDKLIMAETHGVSEKAGIPCKLPFN